MNWIHLILAGFIGACIGGWFGYRRGRRDGIESVAPTLLWWQRMCALADERIIQLREESRK